jgi:hypothetical protein
MKIDVCLIYSEQNYLLNMKILFLLTFPFFLFGHELTNEQLALDYFSKVLEIEFKKDNIYFNNKINIYQNTTKIKEYLYYEYLLLIMDFKSLTNNDEIKWEFKDDYLYSLKISSNNDFLDSITVCFPKIQSEKLSIPRNIKSIENPTYRDLRNHNFFTWYISKAWQYLFGRKFYLKMNQSFIYNDYVFTEFFLTRPDKEYGYNVTILRNIKSNEYYYKIGSWII